MSLSSLMTGADLIVVGTVDLGPMKPSDVAKLRDAPNIPGTVLKLEGWVPIEIRGECLSAIMTIRIERILASARNEKETRKRLVSKEGGERSAFVVLRLHSTVFRDAVLLPRKRHLLWLKRYEMPDRQAKELGVDAPACYTVVDGPKGAVCLSDVSDLDELFRKNRDRLLEKCAESLRVNPHPATLAAVKTMKATRNAGILFAQKILLKNTFGSEDPTQPLTAADAFAEAMMEDAPNRRMLGDLAKKGGVYSSTARELLKNEAPGRFRFREQAKPETRDGGHKEDEGRLPAPRPEPNQPGGKAEGENDR